MAVASDLPAARERRPGSARRATRCCSTRRAARWVCWSPTRTEVLVNYDQISPAMRHAIIADRGPPLLHQQRRRHPRHRPRVRPGRRQPEDRPGRLDDHPAVRQERARGAGRPHGLPEAARGGARLPPHAQVVEGEDPHRVPQRDLLRQRRLRHRVRRPRVLRQRGPGASEVRHARPPELRFAAAPRGGGAAGGDRLQPQRLRPGGPLARRDGAPQPRAAARCSSRGSSRGPTTTGRSR